MTLQHAEPMPVLMGKYRLIAELGRGGMARVFLAVVHGPSGFSKLVVLKMIRSHLADDPDAMQMFLDEARLAGRLNHPNVVHTLEVIQERGQYMMVMEYLEGQSFAEVLRRCRRQGVEFPLALQIRCMVDALEGLRYVHELRDFDGTLMHLVHRDVSPQNIFITYSGQVKVLDFGIAKAVTTSTETEAGVIKGKVAYMAPEQFVGGDIDQRVDIYAVGAILWQLATGKRLWRGVPDAQVMNHVVTGKLPDPSEHNPDVNPELARIVMKALAPDRDKRYASCLQLQNDLEALASSGSLEASSRDLGSFVADLFSDARQQIASTIEKQLAHAFNTHPDPLEQQSLPIVTPYSVRSTMHSLSDPSGRYAYAISSTDSQRSERVVSSSDDYVLGSVPSSQVSSIEHSMASDSMPSSHLYPMARKSPLMLIFATLGLAAVLAVALAVVFVIRSVMREPSQSLPSAAIGSQLPEMLVPSAAPTESEPDKAKAYVQIEIKAEPNDSVIYIDDKRQATNPVIHTVRKENKTYDIRVEAMGYNTRQMQVTAQRDVVLSIALQKKKRAIVRVPVSERREPSETPPKTTAVPSAPSQGASQGGDENQGASPGTSQSKDAPSARDRIKDLNKENPWE